MKGRDNKGRFAKGNKIGIGNRFKTGGEQAEMAKKGGVQSGKTRRAFSSFYEEAMRQGELPAGKDKEGNAKNFVQMTVRQQYKKAVEESDTRAAEFIMRARREDKIAVELDDAPIIIFKRYEE